MTMVRIGVALLALAGCAAPPEGPSGPMDNLTECSPDGQGGFDCVTH